MRRHRLLEEPVRERSDVRPASAQGRDLDADDVQPVEEIRTQAARRDQLGGRLAQRGDDPGVDRDRLMSAEALEPPLLDRAEELRLRRRIELLDLVEEERAVLGGLELAGARGLRVREGALLVAEQLGLDELRREIRAGDLDEGPRSAVAALVDISREPVLAGAGLAEHEHARRRARRALRGAQSFGERRVRGGEPGHDTGECSAGISARRLAGAAPRGASRSSFPAARLAAHRPRAARARRTTGDRPGRRAPPRR